MWIRFCWNTLNVEEICLVQILHIRHFAFLWSKMFDVVEKLCSKQHPRQSMQNFVRITNFNLYWFSTYALKLPKQSNSELPIALSHLLENLSKWSKPFYLVKMKEYFLSFWILMIFSLFPVQLLDIHLSWRKLRCFWHILINFQPDDNSITLMLLATEIRKVTSSHANPIS